MPLPLAFLLPKHPLYSLYLPTLDHSPSHPLWNAPTLACHNHRLHVRPRARKHHTPFYHALPADCSSSTPGEWGSREQVQSEARELLYLPHIPSCDGALYARGAPATPWWCNAAQQYNNRVHCNDLWLQLMTVSLCDGLIRRMYVERERENSAHERGTAYFARPSRVSQLSLALDLATSHYLSSPTHLLCVCLC